MIAMSTKFILLNLILFLKEKYAKEFTLAFLKEKQQKNLCLAFLRRKAIKELNSYLPAAPALLYSFLKKNSIENFLHISGCLPAAPIHSAQRIALQGDFPVRFAARAFSNARRNAVNQQKVVTFC